MGENRITGAPCAEAIRDVSATLNAKQRDRAAARETRSISSIRLRATQTILLALIDDRLREGAMRYTRRFSLCFLLLLLFDVAAAVAQTADKPRRFSEYTYEQLDEKQKAVADVMKQKTLSGISGPNNVLLRSPALAENVMRFNDQLRYNTSVPLRLNELAILLVARNWNSQFEWGLHVPAARKAGLSEAVINDLTEGRRPASMQPDENIVYDFVTELRRIRR